MEDADAVPLAPENQRFVAEFSPALFPWRCTKTRDHFQVKEGEAALAHDAELQRILRQLQSVVHQNYSPQRIRFSYSLFLLIFLVGGALFAVCFSSFRVAEPTPAAKWILTSGVWCVVTGVLGMMLVYEAVHEALVLTVQRLHEKIVTLQGEYGEVLKATLKVYPSFESRDITAWSHRLAIRQLVQVSCTLFESEQQLLERLGDRESMTECIDFFLYPPVVHVSPLCLASPGGPLCCCNRPRSAPWASPTGAKRPRRSCTSSHSCPSDASLLSDFPGGSEEKEQPPQAQAPKRGSGTWLVSTAAADSTEEEHSHGVVPPTSRFYFQAVLPPFLPEPLANQVLKTVDNVNSTLVAVFSSKGLLASRVAFICAVAVAYLTFLVFALIPETSHAWYALAIGVFIAPYCCITGDIIFCVKVQRGRMAAIRTLLGAIEGLRRHYGWRGPTWYRRRIDGEVPDEFEGLAAEEEQDHGPRGHQIELSRRRGVEPRGYMSPSVAVRGETRHRRPLRAGSSSQGSPATPLSPQLEGQHDEIAIPVTPSSMTDFTLWDISGIEVVFPCKYVSHRGADKTRSLAGGLAPFVPARRIGEQDHFATAWLNPWLRFHIRRQREPEEGNEEKP